MEVCKEIKEEVIEQKGTEIDNKDTFKEGIEGEDRREKEVKGGK